MLSAYLCAFAKFILRALSYYTSDTNLQHKYRVEIRLALNLDPEIRVEGWCSDTQRTNDFTWAGGNTVYLTSLTRTRISFDIKAWSKNGGRAAASLHIVRFAG